MRTLIVSTLLCALILPLGLVFIAGARIRRADAVYLYIVRCADRLERWSRAEGYVL